MPEPREEIVNLIIIGTIFFLFLGGGFVLLINLFSKARRTHFLEKQHMQQLFQQEILQARLEIQENTFNNISNEIHDNVGQLLSLAKVQLNIVDQTSNADKTIIADIKDSIGKALSDLRDIAKSLSGEKMKQQGLVQTLEMEVERINRANFIKATIQLQGDVHPLNEQKQLIILRIIQEALQNIIKHARAESLIIQLQYLPGKLEITVEDDGVGFKTDTKESTGLGIQNMISRATLIGGEATVLSKENTGTTIKVNIPYE